MSGLGHLLEREGIATVCIALVREHAARMRPPRALWVPFDLGRPFGAPNEPAFQSEVLRAALALLVREDGPVILKDFPKDAPGQGEASSAMSYLRARRMDELIRGLKQPFLGVCLGMQLMCQHSEENDTIGLGIVDARVKRFNGGEKVPHMGWNTVASVNGPLFEGINEQSFMYFVHSYYVQTPDASLVVGQSHYGHDFVAALARNNVFAAQFHPEKSHTHGLQLLKNFVAWNGQF